MKGLPSTVYPPNLTVRREIVALDRAITDYDQAIELDPQFAGAYTNRGLAYSNKGNLDRAIADLDQAIALNPQYANAYFSRGFAYALAGQYDQALADLSEAIEIGVSEPGLNAFAYFMRGALYAEIGGREKAVSDLERALELGLDPSFEQDAEAMLEERWPRSPAATAFFWRKNLSRTDFLISNPPSGSPSISSNFCSMDASIISPSSSLVTRPDPAYLGGYPVMRRISS